MKRCKVSQFDAQILMLPYFQRVIKFAFRVNMHCVKGALVNPAMKKDEQLTQYMQIYIGQCSIVLNVSSVCILFIYFIADLFQYVYVKPYFLNDFQISYKRFTDAIKSC